MGKSELTIPGRGVSSVRLIPQDFARLARGLSLFSASSIRKPGNTQHFKQKFLSFQADMSQVAANPSNQP